MPFVELNSRNLKVVAKDSGRSEEELNQLLINSALAQEPAYVQVPLPKHLR